MRGFGSLLFFFLLFPGMSCAGPVMQHPDMERIWILRSNEKIASFTVEKVSGIKAVQQGLSGRSSIPGNHGMLFILDSAAEHFFWMKGMKFPVDILFFDEDRRLTGILPDLQPCTECTAYKTPPATAYALEVGAGAAEEHGIKAGYSFFFDKLLP